MKLATIVELYRLNPNGGIAVWSKRLVDYFNLHGIDARIFSFTDGIHTSLPQKLITFPNFREIFVYPRLIKQLFSKLDSEYDVLQLMSPHTLSNGRPNIPTVTSIHYLLSRQALLLGKYLPLRYKPAFNRLTQGIFSHYEKKGLLNSDYITVSRKAYRNYLIEEMGIPAEKIKIIKYGIDSEVFRPSEVTARSQRVAIYVGRGSLPKGFDTLIAAAPFIKGKIIAIASRIPPTIQKRISLLENVEVVSGISIKKLLAMYNTSSVFIMPSLCEGSPISTLEAMACGLPVVCTPEGSGEYIEHEKNGLIFPFKSADKLAEQVNYLFDNPSVGYEFGKRNRYIVETELTLPVIARKYQEIYNDLTH